SLKAGITTLSGGSARRSSGLLSICPSPLIRLRGMSSDPPGLDDVAWHPDVDHQRVEEDADPARTVAAGCTACRSERRRHGLCILVEKVRLPARDLRFRGTAPCGGRFDRHQDHVVASPGEFPGT